MKKTFKTFQTSGLLMFMFTLLLSVFGIMDGSAICAVGPAYGDTLLDGNGVVITEGEYSLTEAYAMNGGNQEFISKHFVQDVVRVDPLKYGTWSVLKSQTNWKKRDSIKDHVISISRVKTPPVEVTVATATVEATTAAAGATVEVNFGTANSFIGIHQTIYFKLTATIKGYKEDGTTADGYSLECRVVAKNGSGVPVLKPLNGKLVSGTKTIPSLSVGTVAYRGSRIGTESQERTVPFGVNPTPTDYYVPKKMIEFGTTGWFDAATKLIRWGDKEIRDNAMIEFMMTDAAGFWLGKQEKAYFTEYISQQEELAYFPEGLIPQAGRQHDLQGSFDIAALLALKNKAFKDNTSSGTAIMAMGSEISPLVQELVLTTPGLNYSVYKNKTLDVNFSKVQFVDNKSIIFLEDQSLDLVGLNDKAFIFDPNSARVFSFANKFIPIKKENERRDYAGFSYIDESINILEDRNNAVYVEL